MKKIFLFSLLMLLFLMSGCSHQKGDDLDNPINKVQLTVNVVDALKQSPVKGAKVLIENLNRTAETREDGKAVFTVNPGEYIISVSKNGYMSNGSQKVRVDKNTSITLELAKEINETLSSNTTVISNGLYKLDFGGLSAQEKLDLEGVKLTLKNSGLSPSDLSKYVKEDTEIAGNIILLDLEDFQKATSNGNIAEVNVNIEFKVHNSISEDRVNYYDLMAISFYGENNYKVVPLYAIHKDGYYSANLPFRINGTNIDKSYIFVYKIGSVDIDYNPTLEDAKKFVKDVKEHGINLTDAGKKQAEVISDNFNNNMVPYVMAIAKRFEEVDFTLDILSVLVDIGPGNYTVNLPENLGSEGFYYYLSDYINDYIEYTLKNELDDYQDYHAKYDEYLEKMGLDYDSFSYDEYYWQVERDNEFLSSEHYACVKLGIIGEGYEIYDPREKLAWNFSYGTYTVSISHSGDPIVKREKIMEGDMLIDQTIIDLTSFYFNFHKKSKEDRDMEWLFKFKWEGTGDKYEKIINELDYYYDYENYNEYPYIDRDIFIIPEKGKILIEGKAIDSLKYFDEEGNKLPSIGEITLNGLLDLFVEKDNIISFNGNLKAEELEIDGDLEIVFGDKKVVKDTIINENLPLLDNFYFNGLFKTKDYKIQGICSIDFIEKTIRIDDNKYIDYHLPKDIEFNGQYENTTEDYFQLNGKLAIQLDYKNFIPDFSTDGQFETADSFLHYTVNIDSKLSTKNYDSYDLELICRRTDYRKHDLELSYYFTGGNYIRGKIEVDNTKELKVKAFLNNQGNLLLEFDLPGDKEGNIGEIRDKNNDIKFADIVVDKTTREPRVAYSDGTSTSLLP